MCGVGALLIKILELSDLVFQFRKKKGNSQKLQRSIIENCEIFGTYVVGFRETPAFERHLSKAILKFFKNSEKITKDS
jgi:hypothetical protein